MDETLGSFSQLYKFWNLCKIYFKNNNLDNKYFYGTIDLFPLFLRPNILTLLNIIKKKKISKICNYVMIYTNNNGPQEWASLIQSYFHHKLNYPLFDKIIRAFKIDGKQIEICRTSYDKSFKDLINCTQLPYDTRVCFLDDQNHKEMHHENVVYINIEPYNYNVKFDIMAEKFYNKYQKTLKFGNKKDFIDFINVNTYKINLNSLKKSKTHINIDILLTDHIIKEIKKFLRSNRNRTNNNYKREKNNITFKKRKN